MNFSPPKQSAKLMLRKNKIGINTTKFSIRLTLKKSHDIQEFHKISIGKLYLS